jgi:lipoprotein-anchoring transpeptidase ErfK/SrfK
VERVEYRFSRSPVHGRGASAWLIVVALVLALLLLLAGGMYLYDHAHRDTIANGVKIDGVNVGGLSESAALRKIQRDVNGPLSQPVTIRFGGRSWTLEPRATGLTVDTRNMVQQALQASREGSIVTRTFRGLFGGSVNKNIPLVASYAHGPVRALDARVSAEVSRPAQDATVQPTASGLNLVSGQDGRNVGYGQLGGAIDRVLVGQTASRTVSVPTHSIKPAVTKSELAARYPAYIVIDRAAFRLHFYEHLKLARTYEIAVGMEGLETPGGLHKIEWKQVNPPWYVPKKAWAGALAGTVVPPGPADPLKARFMSFDGGAGIHGIDPSEYETIGHDASHGCVRMRIPDVIDLYSKTPVGTPVYII